MQIFSFSPFGYEGSIVTVEVDLRRGIPAVDIVGLADGAVKESRERMRSAIRNSNFEFPMERVLISLSPADLKKEGAGFDLAIALAVLSESECLKAENGNCSSLIEENILVMGELELSGKLRGVRGVNAAASTAFASGIMYCIVPKENADEAREVFGMKVFAAGNLEEAFNAIHNIELFTAQSLAKEQNSVPDGFELVEGVLFAKPDGQFDFSIAGNQKKLVRALQIAACGGHNLLAFGPPGCGKTMCLQKFGELLPALTMEESYSVTRIYSLAGNLSSNNPLIRKPPFRIPHQTASIEGICGGGPNCRPGEISLAHNGVLFLDEASEFRTSVLQILRVPLELKQITLTRAGRSTVFPANFQLAMATNLCPCGNYGTPDKTCLCSAKTIELYWKKFGGPLLDRVAIQFWVNEEHNFVPPHTSLSDLREMIKRAWEIQIKRGVFNEYMSDAEINMYIQKATSKTAMEILNNNSHKYEFSPRVLKNVLKLARTLADMNGLELIEDEIMKLAIQLHGHNPLVI